MNNGNGQTFISNDLKKEHAYNDFGVQSYIVSLRTDFDFKTVLAMHSYY